MPLINGQKMACEPCIRGHRSTKCTHANERLMVPVRKPGRPLSACPHSKTQPCGCGNVTAAIPRKQKCHCGTSAPSQPAATPEIKTERDDPTATVRSPTRAHAGSASGPSSHRVQKSVSKPNGTRNPTIDTSKLERMDPSQFNVIASPDATQQTTPTIPPSPISQNMFAYGPMGMTTNSQSFSAQPMMFPMFPQPLASPIMGQHPNGELNKHTSPSDINGTTSSAGPATGSCCGGGAARAASSQPSTTPTTPGTDTSAAPEKKGSCCSAKTNEVPNGATQAGVVNGASAAMQANGMLMPTFAPQMAMTPNGMYPFYPQATIFTYPPQYGSYMQPLQPEQWRQFIANMSFSQPGPQQAHNTGFDMSASMGFPAPGSTTMGGGTTHQCGCGDGCQCVGCAAHPYNEATQNYVRSAWNSMMEPRASANGQHTALNGHANYSHTGTGGNSEVALMKDAINGMPPTATSGGEGNDAALMTDAINGIPPTASAAVNGHGDGTISPTAPQTPSEAASGMSEEQTLSANDFFFVSYPFGDSCAGDTASCPCGDECQCIGCVIHGNANTFTDAL
ncbi:hypothetical protein NLU13_9835 [Sarocladium strictum]|uniref:Copper-fist domain-containing protein n=1 Tax=Sarocladium strictum TaxID=5046 RepID=A0AA39G976_SARSR|nr:hypothetical protein NLU13_9835 [Sarocladium strictum]